MRAYISSIGTGSEVLSYSLQYVQERLHRRIGTMCTSTGCFVETNARVVCLTPRVNLLNALAFLIRIQESGVRVQSSGFRVQGLGFRVPISETVKSNLKHEARTRNSVLGTRNSELGTAFPGTINLQSSVFHFLAI